ncbi:hypothetical protein Leryth_006678 [Lithospermum erythrorhizon]|nr:hypothetical protein Leryth_006678 [Lithospermum erythrorhizon]
MASLTHIDVIRILILSFLFIHKANALEIFKKYHVHCVNQLPNGSPSLSIRCRSKDNDLGTHELRTNEEFQWEFRDNVIMSTLFFCHFSWGNKQKQFDVYSSDWTTDQCTPNGCYWIAAKDGIYYSGVGVWPRSSWGKRYEWDWK